MFLNKEKNSNSKTFDTKNFNNIFGSKKDEGLEKEIPASKQ